MKNSILLLGTGGSLGIPVVGCTCAVCHSTSSKNHRCRCSALLKVGGKQILIDPGPDIRVQCLRAEIRHLDGVMLTHVHHDHSAGVDELRVFRFLDGGRLPFLLSAFSKEDLMRRFYYLQEKFDFQELQGTSGSTLFEGILINYFTYQQLNVVVTGFRVGNLAYVTDIKEYTEELLKNLENLDVLIVSALRKTKPTEAHLLIPEAVELIRRLSPKKAYLIHMTHDVDHDTINQELPEGIELAYDGLEISFSL